MKASKIDNLLHCLPASERGSKVCQQGGGSRRLLVYVRRKSHNLISLDDNTTYSRVTKREGKRERREENAHVQYLPICSTTRGYTVVAMEQHRGDTVFGISTLTHRAH